MSIKLFKQAYATQIDLEPKMFLTELHMEAFLIENPDILSISDINSKVEVIQTQIHIKGARNDSNSDGRLDMLIYIKGDKPDEEFLAVVELKKGKLGEEHLSQLHDYLRSLNIFENKKEIFRVNNVGEKYLSKKMIGILIGSDIDSDLKAKFLAGDTIIDDVETFAKKASSFNRVRFSSWDEYEKQQRGNGIPDKILFIAKYVHDYFKYELDLNDKDIKYTSRDFSLNNPNGKRVKVFAYCTFSQSSLKIYFTYLGAFPNFPNVKSHYERYPNQYFVELKKDEDFNNDIKLLIKKSYNDILVRTIEN
ncbi:MAG: hypothetical protein V5804_07785 [Mucilaginibacter sp.]|uniref:hypothetical protein n=1 Tax=Mucilaginibacter sp. TaxID=1882438 RepID=UPI0034E39F4D